jgi:hypothetical protein
MPVIYQKMIYRDDARRNHDAGVLYVFGDNVARVGYGGQARELRDEPNAVGVATLKAPGILFEDDAASVLAQKRVIDEDMKPLFAHVMRGGTVVWPSDGIGTGFANLPVASPETFAHVEAKHEALRRVGRLFDKGRATEAEAEAERHL